MNFKIVADVDGFHTLYVGNDKTNIAIKSPKDFFSTSLKTMEAFNEAYGKVANHNRELQDSKALQVFKDYPQ